MLVQNRDTSRKVFLDAWRKHNAKLPVKSPMEPMEEMLVKIMAQHPEYHALLENEPAALEREYLPEQGETNPFLHMAMHVAIQEQLTTDRPAGIKALYQLGLKKSADPHALEHRIMECLAEMIWRVQKDNAPPDEAAYLACVKRCV